MKEPTNRIDFSNSTGAVVECRSSGNPAPEIIWVRQSDGTAVGDVPGLRQVLSNGNLVFPPFQAEDYRQEVHAQVYACLAKNQFGSIISRDVNVRAGKEIVLILKFSMIQHDVGIDFNAVLCSQPKTFRSTHSFLFALLKTSIRIFFSIPYAIFWINCAKYGHVGILLPLPLLLLLLLSTECDRLSFYCLYTFVFAHCAFRVFFCSFDSISSFTAEDCGNFSINWFECVWQCSTWMWYQCVPCYCLVASRTQL